MKKKTIECIEMQDRAALRIYETLKGKTQEEEMAYWRQRELEARATYPCLKENIVHCAESQAEYSPERK